MLLTVCHATHHDFCRATVQSNYSNYLLGLGTRIGTVSAGQALDVVVSGKRFHRRRETFFKNDMLSCGRCCCVEDDDDYRDNMKMICSMDIAIISSIFLSYERSASMAGGWRV